MPRSGIACLIALLTLGLSAQEAPRKLPLRSDAPPLQLHLLNGSPAPSWSALRGKVVVLDFWASWCGPCVGAIPHMDELRKELAKEPVAFYSITYEPKAKATAFLEKHPMTTTIALDDDLKTFTSFIAWGIPMVYVIDRGGKIAAVVHPTHLTAADIRAVIAGNAPTLDPHPGWNDPAGAAKYFREQLEADRTKFGKE